MQNLLIGIVGTLVALSGCYTPAQAARRPETITQRQVSLSHTINKFEKSGELTLKEAQSLREGMAKVDEKEAVMKAKNGGKLSYDNINIIERELNTISNKIHKEQLAKRIEK